MKALRLTLWLAGVGVGMMAQAAAPQAQTGAERRRATEHDLIAQLHYNNLQQIELGRLGARQSQDPAVRKLGERLARDYERFDATLTRIAERRGVDLDRQPASRPPLPTVREHRLLSTLEGQDFDHDFLETVIRDETVVISTTLQDARPAQVTSLQVAMAKTAPVHRDAAADLLRGRQWKVGVPAVPPPFKITPE